MPGKLLVIGGAESHDAGDDAILERFVLLAGGPEAHLVVIATASESPAEREKEYAEVFHASAPAASPRCASRTARTATAPGRLRDRARHRRLLHRRRPAAHHHRRRRLQGRHGAARPARRRHGPRRHQRRRRDDVRHDDPRRQLASVSTGSVRTGPGWSSCPACSSTCTSPSAGGSTGCSAPSRCSRTSSVSASTRTPRSSSRATCSRSSAPAPSPSSTPGRPARSPRCPARRADRPVRGPAARAPAGWRFNLTGRRRPSRTGTGLHAH